MKNLSFLKILFMTCLLASCYPKQVKKKVVDQPENSTVNISGVDSLSMDKLASSFKLSCADSSCPDNVGLFIDKKSKNISQCTFTQIDDRRAVTSSHCLNKLDSCENVRFIFRNNEVLKCQEIQKSKNNISVLILSEERDISPLQNADIFLSEEDFVYSWVIDFKTDSLQRNIKKVSCAASFNTIVLPKAKNGKSIEFALSNCNIQKGNSGAVVFDQNDNILGTIESRIKKTDLLEALDTEGLTGVPFGITKVSNIHCLAGDNHRFCQKNEKNMRSSLFIDLLDLSDREILKERVNIEVAEKTQASIYEYKLENKKTRFALLIEDSCKGEVYSRKKCTLDYQLNKKLQLEYVELLSCTQITDVDNLNNCL